MTGDEAAGTGLKTHFRPELVRAITFDFGNTLVPFPAALMRGVLERTADRAARLPGIAAPEFVRVWDEERLRQFAEDVPEGREADMDLRAVRVFARLRGCATPGDGRRWDDASIRGYCEPAELEAVLEAYAAAFVEVTPVPPEIGPFLGRLAARWPLAVVSNWPLALSVERYLEAAGWLRHLRAVVISQRVGTIKPRPAIFEAAAVAVGFPSGPAFLHVGDDPGADVVGAHALGWQAAWVRLKPADSTLPVAPPAPDAAPELTLDRVVGLERALGPETGRGIP